MGVRIQVCVARGMRRVGRNRVEALELSSVTEERETHLIKRCL